MAAPRKQRLDIDDAQILALYNDGKTPTDIANVLGIPRSTVRDRLTKLTQSKAPAESVIARLIEGAHQTDTALPISMVVDLQEIVTWWQERKAALQLACDASRQTERTTFHVEQRWIDAIRRQADLDHLTITQIVNEVFRRYYEPT